MQQDYIIKQVTTLDECNDLSNKLLSSPFIAIDTEFTRKTTYYPILNLIQIAIKSNEAYIVDPMQNIDFSSQIIEAIYQSKAVKVFHSAFNDLEILYNITKAIPYPVFDTQIAHMALSTSSNISYSNLIKDILDINVSKDLTLSDWNQRPLTQAQLEYAAMDVVYLYQAYLKIHKNLQENNRYNWITERIDDLYNHNNYEFNIVKFTGKYMSSHNISNNLSVLSALLEYRENLAKTNNVPRRHIISDDAIKTLVKDNQVKKFNSLSAHKSVILKELKDVIAKAPTTHQEIEGILKIKKSPTTPKNPLLGIVNQFLEYICDSSKVNKELITNKSELNLFLHQQKDNLEAIKNSNKGKSRTDEHTNTFTAEAKKNFKFMTGWRYNVFGKSLQNLLDGNINIKIKDQQIYFE